MSFYPDGSSNAEWDRARSLVQAIVCHRLSRLGLEEYLVEWKHPESAYSWHRLSELDDCLPLIQKYLDAIDLPQLFTALGTSDSSRKRKRSNSIYYSTTLPLESSSSRSSPSIITISDTSESEEPVVLEEKYVYNGVLVLELGVYYMDFPSKASYDAGLQKIDIPTAQMLETARRTNCSRALYKIAMEFDRKLATLRPRVQLENNVDKTRPPLDFEFIDRNLEREGVHRDDANVVLGCGGVIEGEIQRCRPNMGGHIGCEYSRVCECLEFAAPDERRFNDAQRKAFRNGDTSGLPKRFPYSDPKKGSRLVRFYRESRHPVYECNPKCACGPDCKTRLVQKGRTVGLEIFKTLDRGWGLRCTEDLQAGQFIDTYRGEIITNQEADFREKKSKDPTKASYLFTLDKFAGDEPGRPKFDECYVVDGEFMGGVTRFMNHSCVPNCRQYTVSYNKHDYLKYELVFFTIEDVSKGTELTFDYLDQDDEESDNESDNGSTYTNGILSKRAVLKTGELKQSSQQHPDNPQTGHNKVKCNCGMGPQCRGYLWL